MISDELFIINVKKEFFFSTIIFKFEFYKLWKKK